MLFSFSTFIVSTKSPIFTLTHTTGSIIIIIMHVTLLYSHFRIICFLGKRRKIKLVLMLKQLSAAINEEKQKAMRTTTMATNELEKVFFLLKLYECQKRKKEYPGYICDVVGFKIYLKKNVIILLAVHSVYSEYEC